jgi:hypothetical protein
MTSLSVCLFHDRRYASNIQRIFNLLRTNKLKIKCNLNYIGKKSLCTCNLSDDQLTITDQQLTEKQKEYEEIKTQQWSDEIDQVITRKIRNTCDSKISIYKLLTLICGISNDKNFLNVIKTIQKDGKCNQIKPVRRQRQPELIRRQIELSLPPNQIGHLLGRNGQLHKLIMKKTNTRIHFDNVPYSTSKSDKQCPEFNLDLFQSSYTLTATITGSTEEAVNNATKDLEDHEQDIQV